MSRFAVNTTCPYCEKSYQLEVSSQSGGLVHKQQWCPHCNQYQEVSATFEGEQLLSVVVSRAPAPGETQH